MSLKPNTDIFPGNPTKNLCVSKIDVNRLGMSNMKNAIGLGRETRDNLESNSYSSKVAKKKKYLSTSSFEMFLENLVRFRCDHIAISLIVLSRLK